MDKPKQFKPKTGNGKKFSKRNNTPSSNQKGYDADWTRYRFRFLYYNPNCYICGGKANTIDHIVRARDNPDKFTDLKNHCPLCASCHSHITQLFDKGDKQDIEGKLRYFKEMRKRNGITLKIKILDRYKKQKRGYRW